jgi:TonB-dependent starch-binding outer membrane protein SusC
MRLTLFLMVGFLISASARSYSQNTRLDVNLRNGTIADLMKVVEDNSEFVFLYKTEDLNLQKKLNVELEDASIHQVLNAALSEQNLEWDVYDRQIVLRKSLSTALKFPVQQQKIVTGTVTDQNGQPLPGVTVLIKGTTSGAVTNSDGIFSLTIPADTETLQFSFVGMRTQEVAIEGRTTFMVEMEEESIGIDEVVAIGYGIQKKSNITSSISKITDESMKERPIMSVGEALQGQLAGVRSQASGGGVPGRDMTIRIRGLNTINGDASPLYVIDGIPRDNMSDINPNDIASIQILKDAAATAIYGARGGNGVVLLETKRGKGRPTVTFDAYYGLSTAEKDIDIMNGNEWVAYNMFRRNLNHLRAGGSMSDPMSSRAAGNQIPASWETITNFTDWQDAMLQVAPVQNYQLAASAESDIGNIYFSAGYLDQEGILIHSYYKRKNVRLNGTINAGEKLKFGINLTASHSDRDDSDADGGANGGGKESSLHHAVMLTPLMGLNEGTRDWGFPAGLGTTYPNPVEQQRLTTDRHLNMRVGANLWGEYNILKNVTFRTQYGYNHDGYTYEFFQPGNVTYNNGFITLGNSTASTSEEWVIQNTLTYDFMSDRHNLNLLIGQSAQEQQYFNIRAVASGWPYETIETLNVATTPTTATTSRSSYTTASFFGRLNYDYMETFLISASIRYDGSSRFGSNSKWGYFPSVSAGWKINETLMKEVDWISLLKLRAAVGTSGNDRIGNYAYMALLSINNTSWGDGVASGVAPNRLPNENLKWEETETINLGLDFSAFSNRLQINFDVYQNKTTNLLFSVPVPFSTGYSSYTTNIGSVENKGWEVDFTSFNLRGNFNWTTSLNVSRNWNEVLDMGDIEQFTQSSWDAQFITKVGAPVSQFYAYKTNGVLLPSDFDAAGKALVPVLSGQIVGNVKYVDKNSDGKINTEDYFEMGSNLPDFIFGITNRFSYKNFDLSILLQGQYGGEVLFLGARQIDNGGGNINTTKRWLRSYKQDYESLYGVGENPVPVEYAERYNIDFTWDGKTNNVVGTNNNNDERRIYDATYLRVKNITLGYDVPRTLFKGNIIKGVRCYASADNLFIFDEYPGYSVETNSFGNETTRMGVDYSTYPLSRRYVFGVNLVF